MASRQSRRRPSPEDDYRYSSVVIYEHIVRARSLGLLRGVCPSHRQRDARARGDEPRRGTGKLLPVVPDPRGRAGYSRTRLL